MSLSGALNTALTGLGAASRAAGVVSNNLANALTEGYGPREVALSARAGSGGVRIDGVIRNTDDALIGDRRQAAAALGDAGAMARFLSEVEAAIGLPGAPGSLSSRLAAFESALVYASAQPASNVRLDGVADSARRLADGLEAASDRVQDLRGRADAAIDRMVGELRLGLDQVADLNGRIATARARGQETASLVDQRQQVLDRIDEIVPLRQMPRPGGQIALVSTGGALLLDGRPAQLDFTPTRVITADMRVETGLLGTATLNGRMIDMRDGSLAGGALSGAAEVRDELAVKAQSGLDALALDLVERFQNPAVDLTLAPGDAGLFTDGGLAFTVGAETGLAGRIALNPDADPAQGGESWRLRDGLYAATPGPVGDGTLLVAMTYALAEPRPDASGHFGPGARAAKDIGAALLSDIGMQRQNAEARESFATARLYALTEAELARGVDTDAELQRLLLVEQLYNANARMIRVVDEMLGALTRL
ncbi:flagellar hook-associated protein FlgK [Rhodosalinus sp. K401]|uniref:flagellar hook-associated protein FlgK n=1 Tax=Rhodosalinus sp. K401 TaxID=3239195 RepID=UPI0035244D81